MGLTDDMKSLRENIDAAQADRTKWVSDLGKETDAAQADRTKWVSDLGKDTKEMLKRFRHEHKEMAGVLRRDLEAYVTKVRKETKALLAEYRSDIDGAHAAWIGKAETKARKKTEEEGGGPKKLKR